ncbi:MAG: AI-2E family transporter [Paracoccaceae bacterium]
MPGTTRNRLLAVLVVVAVVASLRASYPVSMPIAATVFVIAAVWPIKPFLDRLLPGPLSETLTLLVLAVLSASVILGVYLALLNLVETFSGRQEEFSALGERYQRLAERYSLPDLDTQASYERFVSLAHSIAGTAYSALGYVGLITILVILGLPEVANLRQRLAARFSEESRDAIGESVLLIAQHFRSYLMVTVITSALTGLASFGWSRAMGLDLAATWGLLNFLLNFVPVVGNLIGIVPPTLYALVQFDDPRTALLVLGGFIAIQVTISNFVYPFLQGKGLALPSVAIVASLTFWSWVWGIAGALLAVPLTSALIVVLGRFESTAWAARRVVDDDEQAPSASGDNASAA